MVNLAILATILFLPDQQIHLFVFTCYSNLGMDYNFINTHHIQSKDIIIQRSMLRYEIQVFKHVCIHCLKHLTICEFILFYFSVPRSISGVFQLRKKRTSFDLNCFLSFFFFFINRIPNSEHRTKMVINTVIY